MGGPVEHTWFTLARRLGAGPALLERPATGRAVGILDRGHLRPRASPLARSQEEAAAGFSSERAFQSRE